MNLICLEIAPEVLHIKIVAQTPHEFFQFRWRQCWYRLRWSRRGRRRVGLRRRRVGLRLGLRRRRVGLRHCRPGNDKRSGHGGQREDGYQSEYGELGFYVGSAPWG